MPKYVSEMVDPREIGAFLSQREQGGLAQAMAGSVPGTAEFAAANRGKGRLERLGSVLGSAGGGSSSMALGARGVSVAAPIYSQLAEATARALKSFPRHIREKLRRGGHEVEKAPGMRTASYSPLTGKIRVGEKTASDFQALENSLTHEFGHAESLGYYAPGTGAKSRAYDEIIERNPRYVSYKDAQRMERRLEDIGVHSPEMRAVEYPAIAAEGGVGPIYNRGQGSNRLWNILDPGGEHTRGLYPSLSEVSQQRYYDLRRAENKALEKAHKARGRERATVRQPEPSKAAPPQNLEPNVQKALRDYERERLSKVTTEAISRQARERANYGK